MAGDAPYEIKEGDQVRVERADGSIWLLHLEHVRPKIEFVDGGVRINDSLTLSGIAIRQKSARA